MASDLKKSALIYGGVKASLDIDEIKNQSKIQANEAKKLRLLQEVMAKEQEEHNERMREDQEEHNNRLYDLKAQAEDREQEKWEREKDEIRRNKIQKMIDLVEVEGLTPFAGELLVDFFEIGHKMSTQRAISRIKEIAKTSGADELVLETDPEGKLGQYYIFKSCRENGITKNHFLRIYKEQLFASINSEKHNFYESLKLELFNLKEQNEEIEKRIKQEQLEKEKQEIERKATEKERLLSIEKKRVEELRSRIKPLLEYYWIVKDEENLDRLKYFKDFGYEKIFQRNLNSFFVFAFLSSLLVALGGFCWAYIDPSRISWGIGALIICSGGVFFPLILKKRLEDYRFLLAKREHYISSFLNSRTISPIDQVLKNFDSLTKREKAYFQGVSLSEIFKVHVGFLLDLEIGEAIRAKKEMENAYFRDPDLESNSNYKKVCAYLEYCEERNKKVK